ncbi:hypothetical protein CDCA_CDCA16G4175 [Cyanidium caldarium]|uniref:DUF2993 domain-containing protein n=1 Tax=Cyanidium caldarium TaxID=2771 RepID=A0AAV9J1F4_CYACA|nr:hypothetical protein CDCA_CDCA16G4175 [Cyanidium caldarium]
MTFAWGSTPSGAVGTRWRLGAGISTYTCASRDVPRYRATALCIRAAQPAAARWLEKLLAAAIRAAVERVDGLVVSVAATSSGDLVLSGRCEHVTVRARRVHFRSGVVVSGGLLLHTEQPFRVPLWRWPFSKNRPVEWISYVAEASMTADDLRHSSPVRQTLETILRQMLGEALSYEPRQVKLIDVALERDQIQLRGAVVIDQRQRDFTIAGQVGRDPDSGVLSLTALQYSGSLGDIVDADLPAFMPIPMLSGVQSGQQDSLHLQQLDVQQGRLTARARGRLRLGAHALPKTARHEGTDRNA